MFMFNKPSTSLQQARIALLVTLVTLDRPCNEVLTSSRCFQEELIFALKLLIGRKGKPTG